MVRLTARWVLPIAAPPIENGELIVDGDSIAYCGPERESSLSGSGIVNYALGEAVLMPGFVNVHTHLEYTALRGFLEDIAFFPWIRALTAVKANLNRDDWLASARLGALECIRGGITSIGDNTDAGVTAQVASEYGLRARVYREVFGIDHRQPVEERMAVLEAGIAEIAAYAGDLVEIGVSPHAPYTVRPELFHALARYCELNRLRTSIHLAESPAESDLIMSGAGPFAEMFVRRGIEWATPGVTPTRYLADLGALTPNTLCVHCVHQSAVDIAIIERCGAAIAHCPISNAKLGAGIAPLRSWLELPNIPVGIGTDSAVSNNSLDMFEEMRFAIFAQRAQSESIALSAEQMVSTATRGGAMALGLQDRIGVLAPGMRADIAGVRLDTLNSSPATDPFAALVYSSRANDVCLTMVNGRILYRDGEFTVADSAEVMRIACEAREKIASATPTAQ